MAAKSPGCLAVTCRDPAPMLDIANEGFDEVPPTIDGEIARDAVLAIRLGCQVRFIVRGNPALRQVKPGHPSGSKQARRTQTQLTAP